LLHSALQKGNAVHSRTAGCAAHSRKDRLQRTPGRTDSSALQEDMLQCTTGMTWRVKDRWDSKRKFLI